MRTSPSSTLKIKTPALIHGIKLTDNESIWGCPYYVLSCEDKGLYIRIPPEKVKYFEYAIECIDGKKSLEELEIDFHNKFGKRVDVLGLVRVLANSGFLEGYDHKSSELDTFSHTIYKYKFKRDIVLPTFIDTLYLVSLALSVIINIGFLIFVMFNIQKYNWLLNDVDLIKNSNANNRLAFFIISIISVLFHELGHVFAGLHYGKSLESISVNLYAYIMPMCFLKFKGLNLLKAKKRLWVIVAGVYNNLTLSFISGFIIAFLTNEVYIGYFKIAFYGNLFAVLVNLIPVSLSDGYFAFSLLFDVHDTKDRFIKGNLLQKDSKRPLKSFVVSIFLIVFAFVSYFLLAISTIRMVSILIMKSSKVIEIAIFSIWGMYVLYTILILWRQIKRVRSSLI